MTALEHIDEHQIAVPGGHLAAWSISSGPAVIFLHGGPGDTHDYMRRMAEPLLSRFRCIFFDQRGTGGSSDFERTPAQFTPELLLADLLTVQDHFGLKSAALVGHSWGAIYGLLACIEHPERYTRAALISMGPLDAETERATSEHLTSVLTDAETGEWHRLRELRNSARDLGDLPTVLRADREMMSLRVKAWVYDSGLHAQFLEEYFRDPPPDRQINQLIWNGARTAFSWDSLSAIRSALWLCTGANDSVPLEQLRRIKAQVPSARARIIDRCGHMPWLEYPEEFYSELISFLEPG